MINDFDKSSIEMAEWSCASCGCVQWMPKTFNDQLRTSHNNFWCLNGHPNIYKKKTELEELQGTLMNEYAKNAQLEATINSLNKKIEELDKSFLDRFFPKKNK